MGNPMPYNYSLPSSLRCLPRPRHASPSARRNRNRNLLGGIDFTEGDHILEGLVVGECSWTYHIYVSTPYGVNLLEYAMYIYHMHPYEWDCICWLRMCFWKIIESVEVAISQFCWITRSWCHATQQNEASQPGNVHFLPTLKASFCVRDQQSWIIPIPLWCYELGGPAEM